MKHAYAVLCMTACLLGSVGLAGCSRAVDLTEHGIVLLDDPRELQPFSLIDADGVAFDLARLAGKWTFAFFGFTHCPDVCPTTMSELGRAVRDIEVSDSAVFDRLQVVLVTVDPARDTAQELGEYVQFFSERFIGVRGEEEALRGLAHQVDVEFDKVATGDGRYSMDHTGNIVLIDPQGRYRGFIELPHRVETIRLAYRTLAAE